MTDNDTEDAGMYQEIDGLNFEDDVTASELRDLAERRIQAPQIIDDAELKFVEVSFTFVGDDGIERSWAVSADNYDSEDFEEGSL